MENQQLNLLIPENKIGKAVDIEHVITKDDREKAIDTFKRATKRLLNVPVWHKLCGIASAEFTLIGNDGEEKHRLAQVYDYFKIAVTGPGSVAGGGYDWVQVESISDESNADAEEEQFAMTVRACKNPQQEEGVTAHFFTSDATSTFIINRNGNTITASYYGRNEIA
ncbi:MAG: hypothetical protein HY305_05500, partial [Sphingobacteriales bacterium]|nr:hypothetical protein [Sphingobacteriales bacterium]